MFLYKQYVIILLQYVRWDQNRTRVRNSDLDKLNLVNLGYDDLVLGSCQLLLQPQLTQKLTLASSGQKWLKHNHLASLG